MAENVMNNENVELAEEISEKTTKKSRLDGPAHEIRKEVRALVKECTEKHIPIFVAFYSNDSGWNYNGIMPEEFADGEYADQQGKFDAFYRAIMGLNQQDKIPMVKISE